jgi:hypothetical protein
MLFTMELIMKLWLINVETWLYNNTGKGSKWTQSIYDYWYIKSDTCSVHSQPCVYDENWTFYGNVGTSIQVLVDICVLSTHSLVSVLAGYMKGGLSHGILYIHVSHMLHQVMKQLIPPVQSTSGSRGINISKLYTHIFIVLMAFTVRSLDLRSPFLIELHPWDMTEFNSSTGLSIHMTSQWYSQLSVPHCCKCSRLHCILVVFPYTFLSIERKDEEGDSLSIRYNTVNIINITKPCSLGWQGFVIAM